MKKKQILMLGFWFWLGLTIIAVLQTRWGVLSFSLPICGGLAFWYYRLA